MLTRMTNSERGLNGRHSFSRVSAHPRGVLRYVWPLADLQNVVRNEGSRGNQRAGADVCAAVSRGGRT
jgi:hypothetical protein